MVQFESALIKQLKNYKTVFWFNNNYNKDNSNLSLNIDDIENAEKLWQRFKPFLKNAFPELIESNGLIESELYQLTDFNLNDRDYDNIFLKRDDKLPIAGSIKARGGFYEVLHYAENLAKKNGLINSGTNYKIFTSEQFRGFFSGYKLAVASTGNLGLSIGIMGSKLGFKVQVYMSYDAKNWKKRLLRKRGVEVIEVDGDFSNAVIEGRESSLKDKGTYFIDDEDSQLLFLGYSTAALRLKNQMKGIDEEHPLFVYLPCGVGGAPAGITFGLKAVFGENVHCFYVEPTHSPSHLLGLASGKNNNIAVKDIGLDNSTIADGLAVGKPSKFAIDFSGSQVNGIFTIKDFELYQNLLLLNNKYNIFLEPSATAGLRGPMRIKDTDYIEHNNIKEENISHIIWSTGGGIVPKDEIGIYLKEAHNS